MKLFHGSCVGGIRVLEPRQADHAEPYIYLTEKEVVAAFYLCNAVEKPFYWIPYGFTAKNIPIYHELYPNALRAVSENRSGFVYTVQAQAGQTIPFKENPCARLGTASMQVTEVFEIKNAYSYFMDCVKQGRLAVGRFEDKTNQELENWYAMIEAYMEKRNMLYTPDCSYARFVREKFPSVWARYKKKNMELL